MKRIGFIVATGVVLLLPPAESGALTLHEHRAAGDSAWTAVRAWRPVELDDPAHYRFGELCAEFAGSDIHPARFREVGKTVWEELSSVTPRDLDRAWEKAQTRDPEAHGPGRNAVANYLIHHWLALRFAAEAGLRPEQRGALLGRAMRFEAAAAAYLGDAFSTGHMLLPLHDPFWRTHATNNHDGHRFYSGHGCYVVDSRGAVWQAFGDSYLEWYEPAFRHVIDGITAGLRELLLVFYTTAGDLEMPPGLGGGGAEPLAWLQSRRGGDFYAELRLPSLLTIPMPVSATWSLRTDGHDAHGMRIRRHVPQVLTEGSYDPTLERGDLRHVYKPGQFPFWMTPAAILRSDPGLPLAEDPDVASVRFVQERNHIPTRAGLMLTGSLGGVAGDGHRPGRYIAAGAAYTAKVYLLFANLWITPELDWFPRFQRPGVSVYSATLGLALTTPVDRRWLQPEIGYAWGRGGVTEHGVRFSLGLDLISTPIELTYSGFTMRAKLDVIYLDETYYALGLQVLLH